MAACPAAAFVFGKSVLRRSMVARNASIELFRRLLLECALCRARRTDEKALASAMGEFQEALAKSLALFATSTQTVNIMMERRQVYGQSTVRAIPPGLWRQRCNQ